MKIRFPLIFIGVFCLALFSEPTFVGSQQIKLPKSNLPQTENCDIGQLNNKNPVPPETEFCACEQSNAVEKPTYQTGESPFGIITATARKSTNQTTQRRCRQSGRD